MWIFYITLSGDYLKDEKNNTMAAKPSIPKGTRDFLPEETIKRNYIFDTIKSVFKLYGFMPIETPAMETLSTLMGKYGEEGDRLIFKILNSGDFTKGASDDDLLERNAVKLGNVFSEKALRYDLTVPFARFVVQHRNELSFPFKRYQMQPVWRADRPQSGRYREFYQCDVDIIGSDSLLNEAELVEIIDKVFEKLGINICIKINNRKILSGIAEYIGEQDKIVDITVAIDKLDKIGLEKVNEELAGKGINQEAIDKLQPVILLEGTFSEKISTMKEILKDSEIGLKGIEEMEQLISYVDTIGVDAEVDFDLTLARGLNYYTGAIYEVKAKDYKIGSITGGGRYDNLTGVFGLKDVSGVGVSFGAERIYDVMKGLDLFPKSSADSTKILFVNFGSKEETHCLKLMKEFRNNGIPSELYPGKAKMKKQMTYANNRNIPFVALIGDNEIEQNILTIKDMEKGEQLSLKLEEAIKLIKG